MKIGRQWDTRFKIWDEAFVPNLYHKLGDLSLSGFTTKYSLSLDEAKKHELTSYPEGTTWGEKWEYGWFHTVVDAPDTAAGERLILHIGAGPEMLVYVNGLEAGSIDQGHDYVELSPKAYKGETFDIWAEVYAGHGPRLEDGGIYTRDDIPVPEPPLHQCVIEESHFGTFDDEIFKVYADYHTLYQLWDALPEDDLRTMDIAEGLKKFTYIADFEADFKERKESILKADEVLIPLLDKKNGDTVPDYTIFGYSHIDLAWLWTLSETKRKCARTYSNQIMLMNRYPKYRFLLSEPPILETLKKYYPDLYSEVKERVSTGQFIPEGAVYVESDTNMAGGESLIRQFVLGKRWYMDEFGVDSRLLWLPDCFGFSGALPQIMQGCRVSYFATQKILMADPEADPFPYNIFWWEGIDGSKVLSHIFKDYNARMTPEELLTRWKDDRNQREDIDGLLFPFGYGDGGGGPSEMMVEEADRYEDLEGLPRCHFDSPVDFFEKEEDKGVENTWYGELYLPWHRGTYTSQAGVKKGVRKAEYAIREAEYLAGLLRLTGRYPEGVEQEVIKHLDASWRSLLLMEFHDILPGSGIERVNEEAREELSKIETENRALAEELLKMLTGTSAVFNSLSWEREWNGKVIPSCGYLPLSVSDIVSDVKIKGFEDSEDEEDDEDVRPEKTITIGEEVSDGDIISFENDHYSAKIDTLGRIVSLIDQKTGYEYADKPLNDWKLYKDINIRYDAWELGRMYENVPADMANKSRCVKEKDKSGNLVITVERTEEYFTAVQKIHFYEDSPRIDFETEIDWHERHRILKADFPTTIYTKEVLEEIQFGYIKRPTDRSTRADKDRYETCHHKYAVLTDGENGLALINDCKYGLSAKDSRMSLTLLRAPVLPDMNADQGKHTFTYSILPFNGPFVESRVTEEAYECNVDVTVCEAETGQAVGESNDTADNDISSSAASPVSFFSLTGGHTMIETCKPAFDHENAVVIRLYETKGCACASELTVPENVKEAYQCNMLEEQQEELKIENGKIKLDFHSFEIKTVMLFI